MGHFEIKSKIYREPSSYSRIMSVVLNVSVVIVAMCSIVSMITNGIKIGNVSGCLVAIVVAFLFRRSIHVEGHYEFCILSVTFSSEKISIVYAPKLDITIDIDINSITSIEYSDQLECARLICNYQETDKNKKPVDKVTGELFLYITYDKNADFYFELEKLTKKKIFFVDR